jgi:hypothetical protein
MAAFIDSLPSDFKRFELRKYLNALDLRLIRYSLRLSPNLGPILTDSETTYCLLYGLNFIKTLKGPFDRRSPSAGNYGRS